MEVLEEHSIQNIAIKQIETTKKVYLLSPQRMFSEFNGEQENVKNYNGRQLLEMLQNADDAASEAKHEKKVLIKLWGNKLIIANTGYPFSEEGLNSIFHSHLSPKEAKENQIGKKGLGFRSILSWADKVTINSHELKVAFSPEYSKKVLEELKQNEDFNLAFQKLKKNHPTPISTLVCPDVEDAIISSFESSDEYDTIIQIDLKQRAVNEVKSQVLQDLDGEVLLFLNHLQHIEINLDGNITRLKKEVHSKKSTTITTNLCDKEFSRTWNINKATGRFNDLDKAYEISIAWTDDLKDSKDVVYSYFRTKVPFKTNGILHASFELNADRNLIIKDDEGYNSKLVSLLPSLIAQTSEKIAQREKQTVSYKALTFAQIDFTPFKTIVDTGALTTELASSLKTKEIFPTIDNRYIAWNKETTPVYYPEPEFAEYLSPEKFPQLLLCCETEDDEELIGKYEEYIYSIEDIINDVASKKDGLTIDVYAKFIELFHKYINSHSPSSEYSLFFDGKRELLSFDKPIFLPNVGLDYSLPIEIGVQIVDKHLADVLLRLMNCTNYNGLVSSLPKYSLKEYSFSEVGEMLIRHYSYANTTKNSIIELNQHLYKIYSSESNPGSRWSGTPVLLINKKGEKCEANKLYFGREYGNLLTDKLYSYDKSKIVASPSKHNVEDINTNEWKKYLEWLGVAHFPRLMTAEGENQYADYVMKNFDFKIRVGDQYFKGGYKEFKQELTGGYGSIKVESIDDIDGILANNSSEDILQLISRENYVVHNLEKDCEPESSHIPFWFYRKVDPRFIHGSKMNSYLKWKIGHTPWLNTDSGSKFPPFKTSTAAQINEAFYGLVEKPKLDYDKLRLSNINKDKADYLLGVIGVHKTINTLATGTLYSIFSKLPLIDKEGDRARSIYNQLAANYDEKLLDKTDSHYVEFMTSGRVFCKNGSYIPIQNVHYVNDKRYGDTVINQFNTIDIDRRRGKEKIKTLFGVSPMTSVSLSLDNTPTLHTINSLFEGELESFKPYVYVLRKDVDNGVEKNTIKDTSFKLISQLRVKLLKDKQELTFDLSDYEYLYLKKKNIVYIKAPEYLRTIQDLKDDIYICSAVAEAFSAILDVDSQRQQIRELFSKSSNGRDELLRSEIDDINLEKLSEARKTLGTISDPKNDFWKAFSKCFKNKKLQFIDSADKTLLEKLIKLFPKFTAIIEATFNRINYQNINDENSSELIVDLFRACGITINTFNQFHYPALDISQLYEINFLRSIRGNSNKFKSLYYKYCCDHNELKQGFLDTIHTYNTLDPIVVNEIDFNTENDLHSMVSKNFDIDLTSEFKEVDFETLVGTNEQKLWQLLIGTITEKDLLNQFLRENPSAQSLIYFDDQIDVVAAQAVHWLGKNKKEGSSSESTTKSKRISFGTQTILYDDFQDLRTQIDEILNPGDLRKITSKNVRIAKTDVSPSSNKGNGSGKKRNPKVPKEEIGFIGEYLVYLYLLETIEAKESVKWVSAYAKECGVNLDGKDGLGYDIEYMPNGAKFPRYVEVKVIGWDNAFHISSNEVKHGEKLKRHYEIFLVRNIDTPTNASIEKIQGIFDYNRGKSFTDNDLFSVINDNYIIKFKRLD